MMIDGTLYEDVNEERIDEVVARYQ